MPRARDDQRISGAGDEPPEGVLGRTYRALTLGIVSVVLMIAFEATAVGTAMPIAARELDGLGLYAFAFSGYFTTSLLAMVVSGQWCDRGGPLAPLAVGIGVFAAGLLASGTAQSMGPFVLGRAIQGFGGGLVIVALYVVVGRAYPERLRPAVMAAFAASWVLPSLLGPLVAGTVTEQLGWRWVFLAIPVLVALPLAVMLPPLRRMRGAGEEDAAPAAPAGSARSRKGGAGVRTASGPGAGAAPWRTGGVAGPGGRGARSRKGGAGVSAAGAPAMDGSRIWLAVAVAAGAVLLQYAGQDLRPLSGVPAVLGAALLVPSALRLLPRGTFRAGRGLPTVVLMRGIAAGTFIAAESFIPLMLVTQRGLSATLAGLSLAGGGLTWALGSYVQARPRLEPVRERLVQLGLLLSAAAIAAVPLALDHAVPTWTVALAWCVGGFGMGLVISTLGVLLLGLSAPEDAGANSAALQVCDALSNVVLVAAAGTAFTALGGGSVAAPSASSATTTGHPAAFAAVFLPAALIALAGAALSTRLRPATS
ncbi:MAG TPA: MFS transporter [Streptomyces sp.]